MKLQFRVQKSAAFILDYLGDAQKFAQVHPIIYKIEELDENKYLAFERMPLGLFSIGISYPFSFRKKLAENTIIMYALVMKIAGIEISFEVQQEDGYCLVNEEVKFHSFLPIGIVMEPAMRKYHKILFENIEKQS
jgi:hypothetical protein